MDRQELVGSPDSSVGGMTLSPELPPRQSAAVKVRLPTSGRHFHPPCLSTTEAHKCGHVLSKN